jgi:hypothetical protein
MPSVDQREDRQPLVKPSAVVAAGVASALAAFFTSRFGVAGTMLGAALTAMIITGGSALFSFYMERAAARARNVRGLTRMAPPRRSVLLGVLLAAVASFVLGMGVITAVELGVGKSLSCWVWNKCPTRDDAGGAGAASGAATGARPSILGGGPKADGPAPQPSGVEQPQQTATPRDQELTHSTGAPQGPPGEGTQPAPEAPGGTPPDREAPTAD